MGRHTGAVERLSRREGVDLELKGARRMAGKGALERRGPTPPGQHGMARRRRESVYALQLREKQRAKRYYGVRERQFRNYFAAASKRSEQGLTGERLLVLLEQRLDNVVYRLGLATTRAQARQFVSHGHVSVDGVRCDIPSRRVHPDSVVTVSSEAPIVPLVREATELIGRVAPWLQADHEALAGKVLRDPARGEIDAPVSEGLIVEFYSRV